MFTYIALVLGLVQGITEMLPISSSAHLVLLPWFMNITDPGLGFDVALHLGTLSAIIIYFWRDWLRVLRGFLQVIKTRKIDTFDEKLWLLLVVGTIPGALAGFFLEKQAKTVFRSPTVIVFTLVALGVLLIIAERYDKGKKNIEKLTYRNSFWIGFAQALAIVPGVSRSGATITAGLFSNLSREDAAKFSFLLSAPVIAGAGLAEFSSITFSLPVFVGFLASLASSAFAIKFLLTFVRRHNLNIFAYYRFFLAFLILLTIFFRS